tara:strand:- start:12696 stop:13076 length:381 start_codon:yes stop_codon:yes gene_type:complete
MKIKLDKKSEKILKRLQKKATREFRDTTRMPSLKEVSYLLTQLEINHYLMDWSEEKHTAPAGSRYTTGGGSRRYKGYHLEIPNFPSYHFKGDTCNMDLISTETYYSYNAWQYAIQIVEGIKLNRGL